MGWDKYLWIDIFPLDGIPDNPKKFFRKLRKKLKIYNLFRYAHNNFYTPNKIKRMLMILVKRFNYNKQIQKYINYCSKFLLKDTKYFSDCLWNGGTNKIYETKEFHTALYNFEDLKVKSFKNYDNILTIIYGDYMQLPPEEKRYSHNFKAWKVNNNEKNT